jgi:peptidyl-prolyl cis-trans isomerase A (cyclophilin A)
MFKQFSLGVTLVAINAVAFAANTHMQIKTSAGNIDIELFNDKAPISAKNFENYVKANFYNGTIFHRVIPGFMIQGGGMDATMNEKPNRPPIKNESYNGLKNDRGTLAMARTNQPDSATSQFFINVADNTFLNKAPMNPGYAVFGKVTNGLDIVDKIAAVPTGRYGMHQDVPKNPIKILSVNIKPAKAK